MRRTAFAFCLLLLSAGASVGFEVKDVHYGSYSSFLKWDITRGPVRIILSPNGSADVPINLVEEAVRAAMGRWEAVPAQSFRFEYGGRSSMAAYKVADQINSVLWKESDWPYSSSVLAITQYSYYQQYPTYIADADILVNGVDYRWTVGGLGGGSVNIQQVLMHEFGHLLGLSHSAYYNACLFPSLPRKLILTLSRDDKAAMQFLYGTSPSDFRLISPVKNAVYPEGMTRRGLPLPVFRWSRDGMLTPFDMEFSDTAQFLKKVRVTGVSGDSYAMNTDLEDRLVSLAPAGKVYWRVTSGSTRSVAQRMTFRKPIGEMSAALVAAPEILGNRILVVVSGIALIVLIIVMVLLMRRGRRAVR